ncbi:MAG TPA: signal peptidase I [Candidatus Cybelea sp.]|nr:signal peptidase I [Candidatus Cybelea sp.]
MNTKNKGGIGEFVRTVVYAVVIAIGIRTLAYEPFNIPSESMLPTLLIGDYLFVSKFSYGYSRYSLPFGPPLFSGRIFGHQPERGDVVVFKLPRDNSTDYIKRVVGLPGDHLQMRNGDLYINGQKCERRQIADYVDRPTEGGVRRITQYIETLPNGVQHPVLALHPEWAADPNNVANNSKEFVVPPGQYFMMGDNRDNSADSRFSPQMSGVGFVPAENLVGRADLLFFSIDSGAPFWAFWEWPWTLRFKRFFNLIQ